MYYILSRENLPVTEVQVRDLKLIKFKEIPDIEFLIFQKKDNKNWNLTEVETGVKVISKSTKEELKTFTIDNAEKIITALNNYKSNTPSGYKKIPLINHEPQATGAKLSKVLTYTGIKNKFLVKYNTIQGIDFYIQVNNSDAYDVLFIEVNNHFVNVGNVAQVESIADKIITDNMNIHKWIVKAFNDSLEGNNNCFLGYAEYLNRTEEALAHNKKIYEQAQERQRQREEEKIRKEQEAEEKYQQEITQAESNYLSDEKINSSMFLALCDRYNVKIPIKVIGWCRKSLGAITNPKVGTYSYCGNKSTTIFNYNDILYNAITQTKQAITA